MFNSKYTLPLLGAGALTGLYLLTRDTTEGSRRGRRRRGRRVKSKAPQPGLCSKTDSLTDADEAVIQKMVNNRVTPERALWEARVKTEAESPTGWSSLSAARETSFDLTRGILRDLCPSLELPKGENTVGAYLAKDPVLDHLWSTVFPKVWYMLTQAED